MINYDEAYNKIQGTTTAPSAGTLPTTGRVDYNTAYQKQYVPKEEPKSRLKEAFSGLAQADVGKILGNENYNNTPLGIMTNTILGIPKETLKLGKDIVQGVSREAASFGVNVGQDILLKTNPELSDKIMGEVSVPENMQWLLGKEPIKGLSTQVAELEQGIKASPTAQKLGIDKAALPLAFAGIVGSVALDFTPFGGEKSVIKALTKETDVRLVADILRKVGVAEDIIKTSAPKFAETTSEAEIKAGLESIQKLQKGTTVVPQVIKNKLSGEEFKVLEKGAQTSVVEDVKTGVKLNLDNAALAEKFEVIDSKIPDTPRLVPQEKSVSQGLQRSLDLTETKLPASVRESISSSEDIVKVYDDAVKKVTDAIAKAESKIGEQKKIYKETLAKKVEKIKGLGEDAMGEAGYYKQLAALKGKPEHLMYEEVKKQLTQKEIDALFSKVETTTFFGVFDKINAKEGLNKILRGELVTPSELALLREIFPEEFIKAVLDKQPFLKKFWSATQNILNIPRSIMATADLSAPFRQGIFLIGRPKQWIPAFRDMFKYAFDEKAYVKLLEDIKADPLYAIMRENKVALTDLGTDLTKREEEFMSNIVEKIPIFGKLARGSNRAYSGFLNKLRSDTFKDLYYSAKKLGVEDRAAESIGRFVNSATGRGDLGSLNKAASVLNGILFSPRLLASRLNLLNPLYYYKLDPFVRKEALKSLFTFAGVAATVTTLASIAGAKVEADPRSTDFAKIRIGNTRIDPLGGFQQYIRLASQLLTGKMISSTTGKEITLGEGYKPVTQKDIIQRFFESKASPIASFALALMTGQTMLGQKVDVPTEILNRSVPMIISDMYDIYKDGHLENMGLVIPGILGTGMQTYGKEEAVFGKNQLGEESAQIKPVGGLSEDIITKLKGPGTLGPSARFDIDSYFQQLATLPPAEANKIYSAIVKANPDIATKLKDIKKNRDMGITPEDEKIKMMGVSNGDRAVYIWDKLSALKTTAEKNAYISALQKKGIVSDDVFVQLKELKDRNK